MEMLPDVFEHEDALVAVLRILAARGRMIRERREQEMCNISENEKESPNDLSAAELETESM